MIGVAGAGPITAGSTARGLIGAQIEVAAVASIAAAIAWAPGVVLATIAGAISAVAIARTGHAVLATIAGAISAVGARAVIGVG